MVLLRARAALLLGRCNYDSISDHIDPERQSLLAQLHHNRTLYSVLRRSILRSVPLDPPLCCGALSSVASCRDHPRHRNCPCVELAARTQFVLAPPIDECQFRAIAPGQHLWRIRRRHA